MPYAAYARTQNIPSKRVCCAISAGVSVEYGIEPYVVVSLENETGFLYFPHHFKSKKKEFFDWTCIQIFVSKEI